MLPPNFDLCNTEKFAVFVRIYSKLDVRRYNVKKGHQNEVTTSDVSKYSHVLSGSDLLQIKTQKFFKGALWYRNNFEINRLYQFLH